VQPTICIPKSIACRGKLLLLCISGMLAAQPAWSQCSATPQAALASYGGNLPTPEDSAQGKGFRVWRTMKDPTLGRQWFWIKVCGDSQQPAQLLWAPLLLEKEKAFVKPASAKESHLLVHPGDNVVVTETTGAFSMRLAGHALQAGELGNKIRVEVHAWNNTTILTGKISSKDEVRVGD
jgi:hypothetical protein